MCSLEQLQTHTGAMSGHCKAHVLKLIHHDLTAHMSCSAIEGGPYKAAALKEGLYLCSII